MKNLIQIAGVLDHKEALMLAKSGVDHIGFPFSPEMEDWDLTLVKTAKVIEIIKPPVYPILITYIESADRILDLCMKLKVGKVQIHGDITIEELEKLKLNGILSCIIKSLIIRNDNIVELKSIVKKYSKFVDAFITDTFDPSTGRSGATGKTHNWDVSRQIAELSAKPVILAGGLTPENVSQAIRLVKPAGVDVHTGVEDETGKKDPELVKKFIRKAQASFASIKRAVP